MTVYPLEFHRRFEQKWARRGQLFGATECTPKPDGLARQYCTQATKPERGYMDDLPVQPHAANRSRKVQQQ
jgi:hypothetical protein